MGNEWTRWLDSDFSREAGRSQFAVRHSLFAIRFSLKRRTRDASYRKAGPSTRTKVLARDDSFDGECREIRGDKRTANSGLSHALGLNSRISQKASMATMAEAGMVRTQAHTMRVATPQRTAERRCVVPTPTIAPVIVCVVLTGIPASAVPNNVIAPAASAQKPPTGFSLVILEPMVCTMRQPPK